jgi:hypothetical protein
VSSAYSPYYQTAVHAISLTAMPGVVRKLIVFATTDGLILQSYGGTDPNIALRIEFKSRSVGRHARVQPETFKQRPHLESHGIIGEQLPSLRHSARTLDTTDGAVRVFADISSWSKDY